MKLDYEVIKDTLEAIEEHCDGQRHLPLYTKEGGAEPYVTQFFSKHAARSTVYHYRLLVDAGFIKGGSSMDNIHFCGLTWEGHKLVEALRSDTIWNKIKDRITATTLEQIPALACQMLLSQGS